MEVPQHTSVYRSPYNGPEQLRGVLKEESAKRRYFSDPGILARENRSINGTGLAGSFCPYR
jgi:hypothetical protein